MQFFAHIVAVKRDIELAVLQPGLRHFIADLPHHLVGKKNTAGLQADNNQAGRIAVVFHDLVRQAPDGDSQLLRCQDCFQSNSSY